MPWATGVAPLRRHLWLKSKTLFCLCLPTGGGFFSQISAPPSCTVFLLVLSSLQPRLHISSHLGPLYLTPLAVSSLSSHHSSLPVPSFGAFTQSPPDRTPQVSHGQQSHSLPCLSNQAPVRCTVRAVQTHIYLCSDLNTNLDSDARILHRWIHLATRIHAH